MRKVNFKTLVVAGLTAFILLFLGVGRTGAQSGLADNLYDAPQGTFVSPPVAEVLLMDQCTNLLGLIQTLPPNSPAFNSTERALVFYREIYSSVDEGSTVANAIASGTYLFTTASFGPATKTEKVALKQAAINLLSQ